MSTWNNQTVQSPGFVVIRAGHLVSLKRGFLINKMGVGILVPLLTLVGRAKWNFACGRAGCTLMHYEIIRYYEVLRGAIGQVHTHYVLHHILYMIYWMKILVTNWWGWYQDPHVLDEDTRITRGWLTCSRSGVWSGAQGLPCRCSCLGGFIAHHSTSLETTIVQLELLISPGHTKVLGLWDTQRALHNQRRHCSKAHTSHLVPQF